MRRIFVLSICAVVLQMVSPAPASAWWEFIEPLSGPGRFYGWDIQIRLFCLVEAGDGKTERIAPSSIGVIVSACNIPKGRARRLSIDVGARFLSAKDNPEFANGQPIQFTTLSPAISMNLLSKWTKWDFIDYGFSGGVYWFSSTEFPSFNGAFLEPARFEFHPTTEMKKSKWSAAVPVVRVGWIVFPGGFERSQFAPLNPLPARIARDKPFNLSIAFDLEALLR
jgi:hypothetical protein